MDNDLKILLQTVLDSNSIGQSDINKIQKIVDKYHLNLTADLDKATIINEIKKIVPQLEAELKKITGVDIRISDQALVKAFNQIEKQAESTAQRINKIKLSMDNGHGASEYQNRINSVITSLERYGVETKEAQNVTASLQSTLNSMKGLSGQELVTQADKFEQEFKAVKASVEQAKLSYDKFMQPVSNEKATSLINRINTFLTKNTKITKDARVELQGYADELGRGVHLSRWNEINGELKKTENNMRGLGRLGASLKNQLSQAAESFTQWISVSSAIMAVVYQIKKIPEEVIKVNSAMVELRKVSDASDNEIKKYFDEAAESAKKLGTSVSDLINATADWSRLGYSLPDSKKLAEIATLYTHVGDGIDMSEANESLISTLQGFQLEAEDAMGIIDKFNEVANNFPIDSAGIGEALQRSAASFYAANTDLSKSIALITGTNAVVQDPDSVGNMWKTVSMRIRGTKQELEEAGEETDGMVESTAQLRELIKGLTGFDIMADETGTQFKDVYDIVVGIGHEWKNLTDVEQAGLLETLAGKRQGNALSAALNNVSMIEEAYETAENSAGSALEEQEEYEKGIQYSLDRLEASFQTFANHVLDSDFLKGIVDFGNGAINVIDKITSALGSLGTIGLGAGIFAGIKNVGKQLQMQEFSFVNCFE